MQVFTQEKQVIFTREEIMLLKDALSISVFGLEGNHTLVQESLDDKRKQEVLKFAKELRSMI